MISGIAAFLIIYEAENEGNVKEDGAFGRGHNLLSIFLLFRQNASS